MEQIKRKKTVKEQKIEEKNQRWHTRNRISLVFGSNDIEKLNTYVYSENKDVLFKEVDFHQAKSKAIEELIDNCIDEYYRGNVSQINITVSEDRKKVTVEDNGIGFQLDKIIDVYTKYRTGSKFKDEDVDAKGFLHRTLGQNGLGASATCLTSDFFSVTVKHYNSKKQKTIDFLDGANKIKEHPTKKMSGNSGVRVEVILSEEVYKDNTIDLDLLRKRIIDLSFNNTGLIFYLNNEKIVSKNGIQELSQLINKNTFSFCENIDFIHEFKLNNSTVKGKYTISLAINFNGDNDRENFISFINSTPTYDGGFHHDRTKRIFINEVKEKLERQAKKEKLEIIDSDICHGMSFVLSVIMPNPRFESQTKRKLVKDINLEKSIEYLIKENISKLYRKFPDFLDMIIKRAEKRTKNEALNDASRQIKKQNRIKLEKLLDANERKNRNLCTLFICEGDSAIGGLRSARDKQYQGGIALKGKPLNAWSSSLKDIVANKELSDIMIATGLVIGSPVDFEKLRYSKIVFLADSDTDGSHINALLINFFFKFWPELFEKEIIRIAKSPLFEVILNGGEVIFAKTIEELNIIKENKKIKIKEIRRNKGLGEMSEDAFKHTLNDKDFTIITITSLNKAAEAIEVCFGKESQARKDLLLAKNKGNKNDKN